MISNSTLLAEYNTRIQFLYQEAKSLPWYAVNQRHLYIKEINDLNSMCIKNIAREAFLLGFNNPNL